MTQHDPRFCQKLERRTRAANLVMNLLVSEDLAGWMDSPPAFARLLSENDLKGLAFAVLRALPVEEADDVIEAVFYPDRAPIMPTDQLDLAQARAEARQIGPHGVKAMARACVERMPPRTRTAFLGWLQEKAGRA